MMMKIKRHQKYHQLNCFATCFGTTSAPLIQIEDHARSRVLHGNAHEVRSTCRTMHQYFCRILSTAANALLAVTFCVMHAVSFLDRIIRICSNNGINSRRRVDSGVRSSSGMVRMHAAFSIPCLLERMKMSCRYRK